MASNKDDTEQCTNEVDNNSTMTRLGIIQKETFLFLELAIVTSLMYMGFATCPLLTASCVGRWFGPTYLSAFSLANLMGNLCTQTFVTGIFGAIDTLGSQAMGNCQYDQVGFLAVRGVVVSIVILIPINILLVLYLQDILVAFGEDHDAAHYASRWYNVFVVSLPFSIVYQSLCKFLTVQRILKPVVWVSILATLLIWPTLEVCAKSNMGFEGTAVAYVLFWVFQSMLLLAWVCVWQPHDARTWQLSNIWKSSIQDTMAIRKFVLLGLGGVLAQCEWVFWEGLGLVVGKMGIVAMTAHTIPTQIVFNVTTLPIACGIALAVRIGITLPNSVKTAQNIAIGVVGASLIIFGIASALLYACKDFLIRLFVNPNSGNDEYNDNDAEAFDLAESIWPEVSLFNLNVALFGILAGISTGLGKQWVLGMINAVCLWVFGMPTIYYTIAIRKDGNLKDAWFWMNLAYLGINGSLIFVFVSTDWHKLQLEIVGENKIDKKDSLPIAATISNERTTLLLPVET